jgi:hypothetical protein
MQNTGAVRVFTGCGFFMLVVLIGLGGTLFVFGIHELGEAREFPQPAPITCAELVRRKPDHGWFRLADGVFDVEDAIWEETISGNTIRRAFGPLFAIGASRSEKASIIVETKDPAILALIDEKRHGVSVFPMDTSQQRTHLWVQRAVEGRIPGFNRPGMVARRMREGGISWRLANDYVYIAEGEAPSSGAGWTFIGIGAGLVVLILAAVVKLVRGQSAKSV